MPTSSSRKPRPRNQRANPLLFGAAVLLGAATLGAYGARWWAGQMTPPQGVRTVPAAPFDSRARQTLVQNTANCGPAFVPPSAQMDCAGDRALGVNLGNGVRLIFADARSGQGEAICHRDRCVSPFGFHVSDDDRATFLMWKTLSVRPRNTP